LFFHFAKLAKCWQKYLYGAKEKKASNDQHYDGSWSDFRVNLLIIKPLHNALRWNFGALRPL